jgi:hypothetical protein
MSVCAMIGRTPAFETASASAASSSSADERVDQAGIAARDVRGGRSALRAAAFLQRALDRETRRSAD